MQVYGRHGRWLSMWYYQRPTILPLYKTLLDSGGALRMTFCKETIKVYALPAAGRPSATPGPRLPSQTVGANTGCSPVWGLSLLFTTGKGHCGHCAPPSVQVRETQVGVAGPGVLRTRPSRRPRRHRRLPPPRSRDLSLGPVTP